jgi:hypothetical protein
MGSIRNTEPINITNKKLSISVTGGFPDINLYSLPSKALKIKY